MTKFEPTRYPEKKQPEVVLEHRRRSKRFLRAFINEHLHDLEERDLARAQLLLKSKKLTGPVT